MNTLNKEKIIELLKTVSYPGLSRDIVSFGMVNDVSVSGTDVTVLLKIKTDNEQAVQQIKADVEKTLNQTDGIGAVSVNVSHIPAEEKKQQSEGPRFPMRQPLPGVKSIIAVASGKGGVGKSTVAACLASACAANGLKTGLLDTDMYGPSIPIMFGVHERPNVSDNNKMLPLERHGVKLMSVGFLTKQDEAVIWRGPMVVSALRQLSRDTDWGELDVLVFDLPPGTGDTQLSIAQEIQVTGALIVTTPQHVAFSDVTRGIKMFGAVDVPVLGVIENMSYFVCPYCGTKSEIFSQNDIGAQCKKLDTEFLGALPLIPAISESGDKGTPAYFTDDEVKRFFDGLVKSLPISGKVG